MNTVQRVAAWVVAKWRRARGREPPGGPQRWPIPLRPLRPYCVHADYARAKFFNGLLLAWGEKSRPVIERLELVDDPTFWRDVPLCKDTTLREKVVAVLRKSQEVGKWRRLSNAVQQIWRLWNLYPGDLEKVGKK